MKGAPDFAAVLAHARSSLEPLRYDPALAACIAGMRRLEAVLARPPRVLILGEVNSGKTTIADLLLGMGILPSSVVANTRLPIHIRYASHTTLTAIGASGRRMRIETADVIPGGFDIQSLEFGLPNERLKEFEIVDTPAMTKPSGLSVTGHIRIWCTLASRAWTEKERAHWSALPRRNWHNALLVATHKDALLNPGDAGKVEWRLRAAAGKMFRDVLLVGRFGEPTRAGEVSPLDTSTATLVANVRVWAAEIRERREQKAARVARRLARLTLHHLGRGTLKTTEARVLKEWEADCAALLSSMGEEQDDLVAVTKDLLRRFAASLERVRPGRIERHAGMPAAEHDGIGQIPRAGFPSRRFARLMANDLTALLRFELARSGLRDRDSFQDFAAARAVLLPLAQLDQELATLQRVLAARGKSAA